MPDEEQRSTASLGHQVEAKVAGTVPPSGRSGGCAASRQCRWFEVRSVVPIGLVIADLVVLAEWSSSTPSEQL